MGLRARVRSWRGATRAVIVLVAGLAVGLPTGVWAGHQFSDVPDTHPFHDEISTVAGAGITTGFADGTFRPGSNITRQAAAAFFERGLGRVGTAGSAGDIPLGNSTGTSRSAVVASVGLEAGAASSGNGFVDVHASFTAYSSATQCPCDVELYITQDGARAGTNHYVTIPIGHGDLGVGLESGAVQAVVPLAADRSAAYQLNARLIDSDVPTVYIRGRITAAYVPFAADGDRTLTFEHTCNSIETENNDSPSAANPMPASGCVRARLHVSTDVDYFSLGVASGQTLSAATKSVEGAGCPGDTRLRLLNISGAVLAETHGGGAGLCAALTQSGLATGSYFLEVTSPVQHAFEYRLEAAASSSATGDSGTADAGAQTPPESGSGAEPLVTEPSND